MPALFLREFTLFAGFMACVVEGFAQFPKRTAVEIGIGPSLISLHDNAYNITNSPKVSYTADFGISYSYNRHKAYTARLLVERKGGVSVLTIPYNPATGDPEKNVRSNTTSHYVSFVPALRQYLRKSGFFVEAGPFLAFLIGSNTRRTTEGHESRLSLPYTSIDVGASGSFGYTVRRPHFNSLQFRLVNNIGLADINHQTGTKEWTNSLALIATMRIGRR